MKTKWNSDEICIIFENEARKENIEGLKLKAKTAPVPYESLHDVSLAMQTLNYECALNCTSKKKLIEFLESAIQNPPKNSQAFDHNKFVNTWINSAKQLIGNYSK